MTDPHRYDDDEVRAIFERATAVKPTSGVPATFRDGATPGGMSLDEIQAIGAEAGIDAGRIAEAASALTRFGSTRTPKLHFGVATQTAHTVDLPRILTDLEWDHLVVRLRDAFGAPGTVRTEGSLRTWTHTHLQVLLEPTPGGARLRMTWDDWATKQWVDGGVTSGFLGAAGSGLFSVLTVLSDKPFMGGVMALGAAATVLGLGSWTVGRWMAGRRAPARRARLAALGESVLRDIVNDPGRIPPSTS
jgi:hypothetical protein